MQVKGLTVLCKHSPPLVRPCCAADEQSGLREWLRKSAEYEEKSLPLFIRLRKVHLC